MYGHKKSPIMSEPLIEAHREQGMFMLFSIANIHNKFKSTKKRGRICRQLMQKHPRRDGRG